MNYEVMRPHLGDKPYSVGDTRTAKPSDVQHLVEKGVLQPVEAEDLPNAEEQGDEEPKAPEKPPKQSKGKGRDSKGEGEKTADNQPEGGKDPE